MEKIPTAENFIFNIGIYQFPSHSLETYLKDDVEKALIEFAKLHVQAALKSVAENNSILRLEEYSDDWYIDSGRVIDSYPLTNIK